MPIMPNNNDIITPSEEDIILAQDAVRLLSQSKLNFGEYRLLVKNDQSTKDIILPEIASRLFVKMLSAIAEGHSVQIISYKSEISLTQAADLLILARPYLIKLIKEGAIQSHLKGSMQMLRFDDVMALKRQLYAQRMEAMDELTALSEELGLYGPPFDNPMIKK